MWLILSLPQGGVKTMCQFKWRERGAGSAYFFGGTGFQSHCHWRKELIIWIIGELCKLHKSRSLSMAFPQSPTSFPGFGWSEECGSRTRVRHLLCLMLHWSRWSWRCFPAFSGFLGAAARAGAQDCLTSAEAWGIRAASCTQTEAVGWVVCQRLQFL